MKTTLELPDELVRQVKLHALDQGQKLKDAVADLLRKGLAAPVDPAATRQAAEQSRIERRKAIAENFISGKWGVELVGYEAGRAADRELARSRADLWRE